MKKIAFILLIILSCSVQNGRAQNCNSITAKVTYVQDLSLTSSGTRYTQIWELRNTSPSGCNLVNFSIQDYPVYDPTISSNQTIDVFYENSPGNWVSNSTPVSNVDNPNFSIYGYNNTGNAEVSFDFNPTISGDYRIYFGILDDNNSVVPYINNASPYYGRLYVEISISAQPTPYVNISSPFSSSNWQMGTSHAIQWNDNFSDNVKIELYKSGSAQNTLKNSTSSDGNWNWNVPASGLTPGNDYQIKIVNVSNSSIFDFSSYFTLSSAPIVNTSPVLSSSYVTPNSGCPYSPFVFYVDYYDQDMDNPTIQEVLLSFNGGSSYPSSQNMVHQSGSTNNGTYSISNSAIYSTGTIFYKFRFSDGTDIVETSPQTFNVSNSTAPTANFNIPNPTILEGQSATFINTSSVNGSASYSWNFEMGSPGISTSNYPGNIYFASPGLYNVTLTVTTACGSDSKTKPLWVYPSGTSPTIIAEARNVLIAYYAGDPIHTATGEYTWGHKDLVIRGNGMEFPFNRIYTSRMDHNGALGWNWTHNYDISLEFQPYRWVVHNEDGSESIFVPYDNGESRPLHHYYTDTLYQSGGIYTLEKTNGLKYIFNNTGKITQILYHDGNVISYTYIAGLLSEILFPGGRQLFFGYDGSNRIIQVQDNAGRTLNYYYNANGDLYHANNVRNGDTYYSYDSNHYLTSITDPKGQTVVNNSYDSNGKVIQQTDAKGYLTTIQYDYPVTNATTFNYPLSSSTTYYHNNNKRLIQTKDANGNDEYHINDPQNFGIQSYEDKNGNTYTFNLSEEGNPESISFPDGSSVTTNYNANNLPDLITNQLGYNTIINYNNQKKPSQIILPDGTITYFTYHNNGQLQSVTDPNGNFTSYGFNNYGDLTHIYSPTGTAILSYDSKGFLNSIQDRNGNITSIITDNYGNVLQVTDPMGYTQQYTYDANGNRISYKDKENNYTYYGYDQRDQMIYATNPLGATTLFDYDALTRLIKVTDARGGITSYTYDANGRLILLTNANGYSFTYSYDANGNQTSFTDALSNTFTTGYDNRNRPVSQTDAMGNTNTTAYNVLNSPISVTDAMGNTTQYEYNNVNRLIKVIDALSSENNMTYDNNGNLLSLTDALSHATTWTYNAQNLPLSKTYPGGYTYSYSYDNEGNLTNKTEPNAISAAYAFNDNYEVTNVSYSNGSTASFTRTPSGKISAMSNGNGITFIGYNALGAITNISDPFGNTISNTYDAVGNLRKKTYPGGDSVIYSYNSLNQVYRIFDWLGNSQTYTYDQNGRFTLSSNSNGTWTWIPNRDLNGRTKRIVNYQQNGSFHDNNLTYDANGNVINNTSIQPIQPDFFNMEENNTYGIDDRQLTNAYGVNTHNANGNLLNSAGSRTVAYEWSENDLMTRAVIGNDTIVNSFNPVGMRQEKTDTGVTTRYVQDMSFGLYQILEEKDELNNRKAAYIHGPEGVAWRINENDSVQFYHFDYLGHTIGLSNQNGELTDTYAHDAFGNFLNHQGNTQQPFTYLGQYGVPQDRSWLYYIRARPYDATQGRFLAKDAYPMSSSSTQGINRFVYGMNNPQSFVDVNGFVSQDVIYYYTKCAKGAIIESFKTSIIDLSKFGDGIKYTLQGDYNKAYEELESITIKAEFMVDGRLTAPTFISVPLKGCVLNAVLPGGDFIDQPLLNEIINAAIQEIVLQQTVKLQENTKKNFFENFQSFKEEFFRHFAPYGNYNYWD